MIRQALTVAFLTLSLIASAQEWELVTPVKTRSELPSVQLTGPTTGYMIDRVLGFVLKTTDAGASWKRFPFNMTNKPRVLHMWDEDRGIIAANSGRFYLTDNGWENLTTVFQAVWGNMSSMHFVNDTLGWAGSETGKILVTTDGGASWTQQTSGTTNAIMSLYFVDDQLGFAAATGNVLLRTQDAGATWTALTPPAGTSIRALHFFDAQNGIGVGIGGDIIRTTDGGDTWTQPASPTTNSLLGMHVAGNTVLAMGTWGTLLRSTDAGQTWNTETFDLLDLLGADLHPSGMGLLVGKARVYRTLDFGATWEPIQIGTWHTRLNKVSFGDEQYGASAGWLTQGGFENGVIRTEDGGRHWTNVSAGNSTWLGVHLRADGTGWIGGGQGANRSTTDFFATSQSHPGPDVAVRCAWTFDADNAILAGGYINGGMYRTTNGGSTWSHTSVGNLSIYDLYFPSELVGYAVGEGGIIWKTTDGGMDWQQLTSPTLAENNSVFFLNDTLGFISGGSGHKTTDGGLTWTSMGGVPQYCVGILFTDPDTGFAASVSGQVVGTTDGGQTWSNVVGAPFDAVIGDLALVDGALIIVGRYGDVYRAPLACPSVADVPIALDLGTTFCTGEQPGVQWYLDGVALTGDTLPCITPTLPGNYTVVTTNALGCVSEPSAPLQVIGTGLIALPENSPQVAPNPTTGLLTLTFTEVPSRQVLLCDAQGRVLELLRSTGTRMEVDLGDRPAGLYLLRGVDRPWSVRVVKE